ncbi:MHYT domain-containing protein [Bdellovibrio sp. ArHS]|uniref:MHYT domain-containing protein n=1 Tax=Bdellovibrio sp. ArHS TaxID=1569284 RepID=UPI000AB5C71E|nr:MHYT domain-containing protein [Bdellovibrio sp. ArHS]
MEMQTIWNPGLIVLSVVVATMASYVALDIILRIQQNLGRAHHLWLMIGALIMGMGIWSMHFIGMLAMKMPGMEMAYDVMLSLLSIVVAIAASALAFFIVSRKNVPMYSMVIGGIVMAIAIAGMHYIGMSSMRIPADIVWDQNLIALSIFIAAIASFAALGVSLRFRTSRNPLPLQVFASLLMGAAVSGMHYVGMKAATFVALPSTPSFADAVLGTNALAYVVGAVACVILLSALVGSIFDRILVRREREADEAIRMREAQLREAQAIAHVGSWEWNIRDNSVSLSDEMHAILALEKKPQSLINIYDIFRLVDSPDRERVENAFRKSLVYKTYLNIDYKLTPVVGSASRIVQSRGRIVQNDEGHVLKMIGTTQDITDLKVIEEELRQAQMELEQRVAERTSELNKSFEREKKAKEDAQAATLAKMQFLANMSHEIRTPMNAILGFADLLSSEPLSQEQKDHISRIDANGNQLLRLIDDILDLSKFEAGKVPVEKSAFYFMDLVDEVVSTFRLLAEKKKIQIHVQKQSSLPNRICSDQLRLRQILANLLGNAIKFTEKGTISLRLRAEHIYDKNILYIEVEDTGIGISEEGQKKLFQPFSQADSSIAKKFGGTGLGLILSRHIAKSLGGDLILERSKQGEGSLFLLSITSEDEEHMRGVKEAQKKVPANKVILEWDGEEKSILLAEDMPDNELLIRHYLKNSHFRIESAVDGFEVIEKATHDEFDVILMDVQMPGLDGLEATRRLRAHGYKKPIIALTAHALPEEVDNSLAAGCDAHLTKPVNRQNLLQAISEALTHH